MLGLCKVFIPPSQILHSCTHLLELGWSWMRLADISWLGNSLSVVINFFFCGTCALFQPSDQPAHLFSIVCIRVYLSLSLYIYIYLGPTIFLYSVDDQIYHINLWPVGDVPLTTFRATSQWKSIFSWYHTKQNGLFSAWTIQTKTLLFCLHYQVKRKHTWCHRSELRCNFGSWQWGMSHLLAMYLCFCLWIACVWSQCTISFRFMHS